MPNSEWLKNGFQDLKLFSIDWRRYENVVTATIPIGIRDFRRRPF